MSLALASKSRVYAFAMHLHNRDLVSEESATRALDNHTAAFWSTAAVTNDPLWIMLNEANAKGGITKAWQVIRDEYNPVHSTETLAVLNCILPLNDQGARDLAAAYRALGSFISPAELSRRTERIEMALHLSPVEAGKELEAAHG